jgi:aldose 1-epimerase
MKRLALTLILFSFCNAFSQQVSGPPNTPELSRIIAPGAKVEKIVGNLKFTEGPVWHRDGYLLFSDIPANKIMRWHPRDGLSTYREPSNNSNGLAIDKRGRLLACEHGARRVSITEAGQAKALVERFEGKRLNSPNDLAIGPDGSVYFTDPPYGIQNQPQAKELDFNGVYRLSPKGELTVLAKDFERPNGIALSPDNKVLYVADTTRLHVRAFDISKDGSITNNRVIAQMKPWAENVKGGADGMKVDRKGNLYATGPGGVWVFDKAGKVLGVIETPETPTNCGFGDKDFKTLYITARTGVYRIRLTTAGTKN